MSIKEHVLEKTDVNSMLDETNKLILYNDEVNTFDHVIESLVQICEHSSVQAEQCSIIVHYKGKCCVKSGSFNELRSKHQGLSERGLTVEIQ